MNGCDLCGGPVGVELAARYEPALGIEGVVLENAAFERRCTQCNEVVDVVIPDVPGLIAAVAVARVMRNRKLHGSEIKFLRKALELSAKDLATRLGVRPETLSRWETGAEAISPPSEKLLRLMVGETLCEEAPGVDFDMEALMKMDIRAVRDADESQDLVFFRRPIRRRQAHKPRIENWFPKVANG